MNTELKFLLDLLFDGEDLTSKLIKRQNFFTLLPQVFSITSQDLPRVRDNWRDLAPEIAAMKGSAQELDLIEYIKAKFKGAVDNIKAQTILDTGLDLIQSMVQKGIAFQAALAMPNAPPPPPSVL